MNNRLFFPTLDEGKTYLEDYDFVPITTEILYDANTLVNIFLCIKDAHENAFLLESVENGERFGRYSFIAFDPEERIEARGNLLRQVTPLKETLHQDIDPLEVVGNLLLANRSPQIDGAPKFTGGFLGYFSYDTVRYIEPTLTHTPPDDLKMPDILLFKCKEIVAFDHLTHKLSVTVNVSTQGDFEANYALGVGKAEKILGEITRFNYVYKEDLESTEPVIRSNISKERYLENVEEAKRLIREGDIFQVVLSNRFEVENAPDAFNIYRMLRSTNPSPYMYFLKTKDFAIAGASPEMLVNVENGRITTKPIAGTIPRGKDAGGDKVNEARLLADEKERAEHTMLVDLGRNDIGKVSVFGTVEVPQFMTIEKYSQLFHLTSQVEGELRKDKSLIDALKAVLPAGTLSGAPKVRAMEIIDRLETTKRNLYGGTIGYISFAGVMDTCIAIRTVLVQGGKAYIQAGAGIVHDSIPEKEYQECETKAKALIRAIKEATRL